MDWGGQLQNHKSLLPPRRGHGETERQLREEWDAWCRKAGGYDADENARSWHQCDGGGREDFTSMIGQAHKAGMRRPARRIKAILDPDYHFFLTDLIDLRHSPLPLGALRDAFGKCLAHIKGLKAYWLAKMPFENDEQVKRHFD